MSEGTDRRPVLAMPDYILASFDSSHDALTAEQTARAAGFRARLVPTPERVRAGCGLSLRMNPEDVKKIDAVMREVGIEPSHYTLMTADRGRRVYVPLDLSQMRESEEDVT